MYSSIINQPFFYSAENAHAYEFGHVVSGRFVLERDAFCEFDIWPLAVSMPSTKVCPQYKAAVPVKQKTCERCDHVFRSKRKTECNLREKGMKRMRAVESGSVKSARKAKGKLHKACEKVSETRKQTLQGWNKTECAWQT